MAIPEKREQSLGEIAADRQERWQSAGSTSPMISAASSLDLDDSYETYKHSTDDEEITAQESKKVL
jgi:hypothetical protein